METEKSVTEKHYWQTDELLEGPGGWNIAINH